VGIDPYKAGMFVANPYASKVEVGGPLVVVLDGHLEGRGLQLIKPISRAVNRYQVHELILTDEEDAGPGTQVNAIAYLGFMEFEQGGVLVTGDQVWLDNHLIGELAGFDETHMPNHLNIVIKSKNRRSGWAQEVSLGARVCFRQLSHNRG